jgi:hypothetical protein
LVVANYLLFLHIYSPCGIASAAPMQWGYAMILLHRIAIVVTLLVLNACDSPTSSVRSDIPLEGVAAYFPVSVGNTWVYATTDQEGQPAGFDTATVTSVESNLATIRRWGFEIPYRVTEDAVTLIGAYSGMPDTSGDLPLIRTPISVGAAWKSFTQDLRIIAVDTSVATEAGIFADVIVVQAQECAGYGGVLCFVPGDLIRTYYTFGVGEVKRERWQWRYGYTDSPPYRTQSLVSYSR